MCLGKKQTHSFADILKGITHAVNSVQEMLHVQQIDNLQKFWKDTAGEAVTQKVKVGDKEMDIPLVSLVSHSHLEMEDLEIHFKTKVGDVTGNAVTTGLVTGTSVQQVDLQMEVAGVKANDSDVMDITIRFKKKDMPEGLARLTDEYNKLI